MFERLKSLCGWFHTSHDKIPEQPRGPPQDGKTVTGKVDGHLPKGFHDDFYTNSITFDENGAHLHVDAHGDALFVITYDGYLPRGEIVTGRLMPNPTGGRPLLVDVHIIPEAPALYTWFLLRFIRNAQSNWISKPELQGLEYDRTVLDAIDTRQTVRVNFNTLGPSSLDLSIYCLTKTSEWAPFHEAKQEILLRVINIIHAPGANLAFPTSKVYLSEGSRQRDEVRGRHVPDAGEHQ